MSPLLKSHFCIAVAAAALLVGCSSGGESGTGATANNQTSQGVITGFGSIFVNGVEYNTDQASVSIDGMPSTESSLAVGMVVTIVGSVDNNGVTGTADMVTSKTEVEGLVFENNIAIDNTINVMGQTVHITNDTRFKPETSGIASIDMLVANTSVVEVSGFSNNQGDIYATYVKVVENSGTASEVKLYGVVSNISGDSNSGSFNIGNISVTYVNDGTTNFEDGMTVDDLADGLSVSVESDGYMGTGSVLAKSIEKESFHSESEGTGLELEGVVTDNSLVVSDSQFELNGRVVHFDSNTVFKDGDSSMIQNEVTLEVNGVAQADGSILADEIDFRSESSDELTGNVITIGDNTLAIDTTLFVVNGLTQYEDEVEYNHYFHFDDITVGMMVEVKYYFDPQIGNVATSIERVM